MHRNNIDKIAKRTLVLLLIICLFNNGCSLISGVGMKSKKEENKRKSDKLHSKVIKLMDRVSD